MLLNIKEENTPEKGLKHAADVRQLSDKMHASPLFEQLKLVFEAEKGTRMDLYLSRSEHKNMRPGESRRMGDFHVIIAAAYSSPKDEWTLHCSPVEEAYADYALSFLNTNGFRAIRKWLDNPKERTWYTGHRMLLVGVNENMTESCVLELYNDGVVRKIVSKIR